MRFNPLTPKLSKISLNNNLNDDDKLSLLFHIVQVNQASSDEEISLLARNATLVDGLLNAGWFHHLTMTNKHLAMQTFAEFYVLKKRKDPLDQLCNGLENLGILSLIRGYPSLMKPYFVAHELPSLTSKDILDSFSYRMVSEPDDERSVRADRFMQQAVLKVEEGTVTKTFNNT